MVRPRVHGDGRGVFLEWFRHEVFGSQQGHGFALAQANCSVSRFGTVRGVHFAQVPPGQAKYVTCVRGAVMDVVVDLRVGSATFGTWEAVRLDEQERAAVYLTEGLGHAFAALTDDATVVYLCSEVYAPEREFAVNPVCDELDIDWAGFGVQHPQLSAKDAAAPTLSQALAQGLLPDLRRCQQYVASLPAPGALGVR